MRIHEHPAIRWRAAVLVVVVVATGDAKGQPFAPNFDNVYFLLDICANDDLQTRMNWKLAETGRLGYRYARAKLNQQSVATLMKASWSDLVRNRLAEIVDQDSPQGARREIENAVGRHHARTITPVELRYVGPAAVFTGAYRIEYGVSPEQLGAFAALVTKFDPMAPMAQHAQAIEAVLTEEQRTRFRRAASEGFDPPMKPLSVGDFLARTPTAMRLREPLNDHKCLLHFAACPAILEHFDLRAAIRKFIEDKRRQEGDAVVWRRRALTFLYRENGDAVALELNRKYNERVSTLDEETLGAFRQPDRERLKQIRARVLGIGEAFSGVIAKELGITDEQRRLAFPELHRDRRAQAGTRLIDEAQPPKSPAERKREMEAVLTPAQRAKWEKLQGDHLPANLRNALYQVIFVSRKDY